MKGLAETITITLTATLSLVASLVAQQRSAGYQTQRIVDEARKRPIHLDIWYPTATSGAAASLWPELPGA